MKKYSIIIILIAMLMLPVKTYPQGNMYDSVPWCFWCMAYPFGMVFQLYQDINASRTVSVDIHGAKGVFKRNTVVFNKKGKGEILGGELLEEVRTIIKGEEVILLPGNMEFHENGNISRCRFISAVFHKGDGTPVQSFTYAELYEDETLKRTFITPNKAFYYEEHFTPAEDEKPAGIDLVLQGKRRDVYGPVSFYPDGRVKQCMTAVSDTYSIGKEKVLMPRGTLLDFTLDEIITAIEPQDEKRITLRYKGKLLNFRDKVVLYENGALKSCKLNEPLNLRTGNYFISIHGPANFYDNGIVESCCLAKPALLTVNGNRIYFSQDDPDSMYNPRTEFYRNGKIKSGRIEGSMKQVYRHKGYSFSLKQDWKIEFFENGVIKSLCPAQAMDITIKGVNLVLTDFDIRFYRDGKFLSLPVKKDTTFTYMGNHVFMDCYVGRVFLNREQDIIAFTNSNDKTMNVNGRKIVVPEIHAVGYEDYSTLKVSFLQVYSDSIILPENVQVKDVIEYGWKDIFVRADTFYNREDNGKTRLMAKDVRELMFSEDTVIVIDGREVFCPEMEWVKVK